MRLTKHHFLLSEEALITALIIISIILSIYAYFQKQRADENEANAIAFEQRANEMEKKAKEQAQYTETQKKLLNA